MALLQPPHDFLEDFRSRIATAQKRVWLQAMVIESGEVMDSVKPLLIEAAGRGVDVRVCFDWVTKRYLHGDIRLTPTLDRNLMRNERIQHEKNNQLWAELREAGAKVIQVNTPFLGQHIFPVMGRNHIKIYAVDDVAWMGGMNFFDSSFENLDFMVRFESDEMVKALTRQYQLVNDQRVSVDYIQPVGSLGYLIVDAGRRGESLIYDQALEMVEKAEREIIFVSQLVPENKMLDVLFEKAEAGVKITIYTSHPEDKTFTHYPLKYFYTVFRDELAKSGAPIQFIHLDRKIHAKLIVVDGKETCFGSHNFVESGVQMGTQEIALRTEDADLIEQLISFVVLLQKYIP